MGLPEMTTLRELFRKRLGDVDETVLDGLVSDCASLLDVVEQKEREFAGEDRKVINVLSLGAGVQSTTVLLMSLEGLLPRLDHVVFADTGWEPDTVYKHLEWLQTLTKIDVVSAGNIRDDALVSTLRGRKSEGSRQIAIPYFLHGGAMLKRQCTNEYKIEPIRRFLWRDVLGLERGHRAPKYKRVRLWFGISLDEMQRMAKDPNSYIRNYYPLVEKRLTRKWCEEWLQSKGVTPVRSACIGCPYKTNKEWKAMRDNAPATWQDAVDFDNAIRTKGDMFIHHSCVPLSEACLDKKHLSRWQDECTGMCGM
jgi:hypothetical protein